MTVEGHLHYVDPVTDQFKEITVPPHTHPESMQFYWTYDSSSVMADPGAGRVRTDTAAGVPSTQVAVSVLSEGGVDVSNILKALKVGDTIYFQAKASAVSWGRYQIRAAVSVTATWALIPVSLIEMAGTPIAKNVEVMLRFTYGINGGGYGADAASPSKGRNRIVNGDFAINQRGFVETQIYGIAPWTFDRWYASGVGQGAGALAYLSPVVATVGDLPEAARNYAMLSSYNPLGAAHYVAFGQKMEDAGTLSGKTATFSFWGKNLQAGTYKYAAELVQNFGTGGSPSPSTFTLIGVFTLTNTWTRYSATFEVPSIAGKVRGTDNNSRATILTYNSMGTDTNPRFPGMGPQHVNTCLWGFQIEEGPVATLFERRSYGDNLLQCMRHFQRHVNPPLRGVAVGSTTLTRCGMPLGVPMQRAPTTTMEGAIKFYDGTAVGSVTTGSWQNTIDLVEFSGEVSPGGFTPGRVAVCYNASNESLYPYIDLDAEP